MVNHKSDLVDVNVFVHAETQLAYLVSLDGDKSSAQWVPKSQCEIERHPQGHAILTAPEWFAIDRGFV